MPDMQGSPSSEPRPVDPHFFELFCGAVETGLEYVDRARMGRTHIGSHPNWPELRYHEGSGLPWVSTSSVGPQDYGDVLRSPGFLSRVLGAGEPRPDFEKERSFISLVDYARAQPRLQQYLVFEPHDFGTFHLQMMVSDALDRYIHSTQLTGLDPEKLLPIYLPLERPLFSPELPIVAVVPILFLKFNFSRLQFDASLSVERLSDDFHLARGWRGPFGDSHNSLVESAATHGIFIRDMSFTNEDWLKFSHAEMDPGSYPVEKIDAFFAALRIATGHPTGYAQIASVPVGWASSYAASITPVSGPRIKKYPPFFEGTYWREQVPTVSSARATEAKQILRGLGDVFKTAHAKKVRLAMDRLNLSATRSTDEDGIIDSMIALEALLSDTGPQEMTHKVAMRLGGLYKILDVARAAQAFEEMKQIYNYRSRIVHGSADAAKYQEINRGEGKIAAIDAALEHLRNAFAVLLKNPALLDPKKIDDFLLTDTQ